MACLVAASSVGGGPAAGAPLFYVLSNLAFNVLALRTLRQLGSAAMGLAMAPVTPLTVAAFAMLPLPLLPASPPLTARFLLGVLLLLAGVALYNGDAWGGAAGRWWARLREKAA